MPWWHLSTPACLGIPVATPPGLQEHLEDRFIRQAELIRVIDGDTLRLQIDLGWATEITDDIRPVYVNTPETRGAEREAGLYVKEQVERWFERCRQRQSEESGRVDRVRLAIRSDKFRVGKYGRCLCRVTCEGVCFNDWLLENRLAWKTDMDGSTGERDIELLTGIPHSIRERVLQRQISEAS